MKVLFIKKILRVSPFEKVIEKLFKLKQKYTKENNTLMVKLM